MVEFAFDLRQVFPQSIIRVQPHHLRPGTPGCKLSQILDSMGRFSAWAQGLRQPVTVAGKLAGDQVVYLITDMDSGRPAVTGLLKVGTKDLFLYDEKGAIQHCDRTPAILDFYVHETRQRRGQGKRLFDRMLADQGWKAFQCSVDRPSHLMKAFLGKHYGLVRTIPQANNFVLYEGFFDGRVPAITGRVRDIFNGGLSGVSSGVSRTSNSQTQINQHHKEQPGYKHGNGRGQKLPVLSSSSTVLLGSSSASTVADILGVGDRINNGPPKGGSLTKIRQ